MGAFNFSPHDPAHHRYNSDQGTPGAHADLGNALLLKDDAQGAHREIEQETSESWKM